MLFVCTGNVCRSPMAAAFFERRLVDVGVPVDQLVADGALRVHSAGMRATRGRANSEVLETMAGYGVDLGGHRSTQLTDDHLGAADLVVGMTREHVRELSLPPGGALAKTFTFKELVRRGTGAGPANAGAPLVVWLDEVAAGRRPRDLMGYDDLDDINDPMGKPLDAYLEVAEIIDGLAVNLAVLVAPLLERVR